MQEGGAAPHPSKPFLRRDRWPESPALPGRAQPCRDVRSRKWRGASRSSFGWLRTMDQRRSPLSRAHDHRNPRRRDDNPISRPRHVRTTSSERVGTLRDSRADLLKGTGPRLSPLPPVQRGGRRLSRRSTNGLLHKNRPPGHVPGGRLETLAAPPPRARLQPLTHSRSASFGLRNRI